MSTTVRRPDVEGAGRRRHCRARPIARSRAASAASSVVAASRRRVRLFQLFFCFVFSVVLSVGLFTRLISLNHRISNIRWKFDFEVNFDLVLFFCCKFYTQISYYKCYGHAFCYTYNGYDDIALKR